MKNKAGITVIKGETFPYDLLVCLGVTKHDILRYTDKNFIDCFTQQERDALNVEGKKGFTMRLANRAVILWIPSFPKTAEEYGHLAHEIFHASDLMLRRAGLTLSDDSDEAFAYQIEYFTRIIYTRFNL